MSHDHQALANTKHQAQTCCTRASALLKNVGTRSLADLCSDGGVQSAPRRCVLRDSTLGKFLVHTAFDITPRHVIAHRFSASILRSQKWGIVTHPCKTKLFPDCSPDSSSRSWRSPVAAAAEGCTPCIHCHTDRQTHNAESRALVCLLIAWSAWMLSLPASILVSFGKIAACLSLLGALSAPRRACCRICFMIATGFVEPSPLTT